MQKEKLTYKEALDKIQSLKYWFIGDKDQLLYEIDCIIEMTKKKMKG